MPATVAAPFPPGARRCRRASGRSGGIEGHRGLRAGARSATVRGGHAMAGNPYRDATLPAMLDAVAARFGDREAVVLRERRLTYADLHREVGRLARGLLAPGVGPGDTAALWLTNLPEGLLAPHAPAPPRAGGGAAGTRPRRPPRRAPPGASPGARRGGGRLGGGPPLPGRAGGERRPGPRRAAP